MCTYNGERFLSRQLESIARQTLLPSELIVRDDRSTDSSPDIIRAFAAQAPFRVRLEINERRIGSTKNFEAAIGDCSGELIFLADQDDLWRPQKIAAMLGLFDSDPAIDCLFSDAQIVDDQDRATGMTLWQHIGFTPQQQSDVHAGRAFERLVIRNVATGATMAFRSRCRALVLPIPEAHAVVHDRWIALLVAAAGRIDCVAEPLIDYRHYHAQQIGPGPRAGSLGARIHDIGETGPRLFREWAGQLDLVLERLHDRDVVLGESRSILIRDRIQHLVTRAEMPASFTRRLRPVANELASGRYHRHSNGLLSLFKDVFRAYPR